MNLTEHRNRFDVHEEHMRKNGYSASRMQFVDIPEGSLQIENCNECPLVTVSCLHSLNKWWLLTRTKTDTNDEVWEKCEVDDPRLLVPGLDPDSPDQPITKLLCEFCGLDVT